MQHWDSAEIRYVNLLSNNLESHHKMKWETLSLIRLDFTLFCFILLD